MSQSPAFALAPPIFCDAGNRLRGAPAASRRRGAARAVVRAVQHEAHKPRYHEFRAEDIESFRVRHVRLDTEEVADSVFEKVRTGVTSLRDVAWLSRCSASRARGGDLGWWWGSEKVPEDTEQFGMNSELLEAALQTRPHSLERVRTKDGWHVFEVEEVRHVLKPKRTSTNSKFNPNRMSRIAELDVVPLVPMSYAMETLGCQMNKSDSERMAGELERLGYHKVEDPFSASVFVLNTCSIRDHAESKVYSYLGRHVNRKRLAPQDVTLCVAGCVAQQEGEKLLRRVPELDLVFGPQYANRLGDLLEDVQRNQCQLSATEPIHIQEDISKPRRSSDVTAWVNVMYGCGEKCTFCVVGNLVRSVEQSRSLDAVRAEVQQVASEGYREVVLLGQNIDAYGRDMYPKKTFAELLRFIHDVPGIERIRFTTSHPRYISTNLVATCAALPKVMPSFHIPPQSGDNEVLKNMKRGYKVEHFLTIVGRIREHIPDAGIGGDVIVGFPGETEAQFQNTLSMMKAVKFDVMNTASYSPRPQTPAAEFEDQIPESVKADRLARANRLVTEHALESSERYVGRVEHVLVEDVNPKDEAQVVGRTPTNRLVKFPGDFGELKGKIVPVKITKAFAFSVIGVAAGNAY